MDSGSEIQSYAPRPPTTTGNGGGEETNNKWSTATTTAPTLPPNPNSLPITISAAGSSKKLTLIPLIFLIYFEVAGGPFGEEPAVKAAGPLCAILGFLIFPFVWSVPEALITAELSTAFPSDGGFTIWATQAFGPFWGSLMGLSKFFSGVINTASFPVLAIDYLQNVFPVFAAGTPRRLALVVFSLVLSFLNYTGLSIVGYASVCLGLVSLFPFVVLSLAAIPKVRPRRWLSWGNPRKDWNLFFNTLFWNLNFWDNVSTLAGEVREPQRTFPRALVVAVVFTCAAYLVPLLAATGSISAAAVPQDRWVQGFFAEIAEMIVGKWVKYWIEIGAVLSVVGLFEAQLSSCAFGLLGMADMGFLPAFFALRSRFDTPWVGILLSAAISVGASYLDFDDIISSANFLYSLGMLLEFASFVWLRVKMPGVERPYRIPLGPKLLSLLLLVPSAFLVYIMVIATKVVFLVSGIMMVAVVAITFLMRFCKSRGCLSFSDAKIES